MTSLIVDASVAVKWFLPEIYSESAVKLLKSKYALLAPDLIWAEVGNTLWKKVNRSEISMKEANGILADFLRFPIQTYNSKTLLNAAWNLTFEFGGTVYDALYLALAIGKISSLVTADRKFYELLQKTSVGQKLIWIENIK